MISHTHAPSQSLNDLFNVSNPHIDGVCNVFIEVPSARRRNNLKAWLTCLGDSRLIAEYYRAAVQRLIFVVLNHSIPSQDKQSFLLHHVLVSLLQLALAHYSICLLFVQERSALADLELTFLNDLIWYIRQWRSLSGQLTKVNSSKVSVIFYCL